MVGWWIHWGFERVSIGSFGGLENVVCFGEFGLLGWRGCRRLDGLKT